MADQICLENSSAGSTQVFKIKARLRVKTTSRLKVDQKRGVTQIWNYNLRTSSSLMRLTAKTRPLRLHQKRMNLFIWWCWWTRPTPSTSSVSWPGHKARRAVLRLTNGSSNFWKKVVLQKLSLTFTHSAVVNFNKRTGPITLTVIQFSGMGPDKNYIPGSNGFADKNGVLRHYKIELGPLFASQLSRTESHLKINQLLNVDSIGENFENSSCHWFHQFSFRW